MKKQLYQYDLSKEMFKSLAENENNIDSKDITKAIDHLNSASELLDEAGFQIESNKIINLLTKIAGSFDYLDTDIEGLKSYHEKNHKNFPKLHGTQKPVDYTKIDFGYTDEEMNDLLRDKTYEDIELESLLDDGKKTNIDELSPKDKMLTFKSLAQSKILKKKQLSDPHTHGLTSDKMIENLKHHGTVFNMSSQKINTKPKNDKSKKDKNLDDDKNNADKEDKLLDEDITFED